MTNKQLAHFNSVVLDREFLNRVESETACQLGRRIDLWEFLTSTQSREDMVLMKLALRRVLDIEGEFWKRTPVCTHIAAPKVDALTELQLDRGIRTGVFSVGLALADIRALTVPGTVKDSLIVDDCFTTASETVSNLLLCLRDLPMTGDQRAISLTRRLLKLMMRSFLPLLSDDEKQAVRRQTRNELIGVVKVLKGAGFSFHHYGVDEVFVSKDEVVSTSQVLRTLLEGSSKYNEHSEPMLRHINVEHEETCLFLTRNRFITRIQGKVSGNYRKDF